MKHPDGTVTHDPAPAIGSKVFHKPGAWGCRRRDPVTRQCLGHRVGAVWHSYWDGRARVAFSKNASYFRHRVEDLLFSMMPPGVVAERHRERL